MTRPLSLARWSGLGLLAVCIAARPGVAQVATQIVPSIEETGAPTFVFSGAQTSSSSGAGTSGSASRYSGAWGSSDAMSKLLSQSYGADAVAAAKAAGINPDTLAAFGQIESHFQNTGNSSSSATGVWQITNGTWNDYASKLGLSSADRNDPTAQAKVASAIISSYASAVSKSTGTTATSAQVYAAYMFGPSAGSKIAAATSSTPLSSLVSGSSLAANNMSGWTVGQYLSTVSTRMGSGASETATG
ncbi:transglycosylase SLT domain-containing protein [Acetobacter lambici]|uniref:Lytic transglycosylase domain-containing protein n=1 Tax=Acetobacter lambici TaxID=1332824 RepID=A0ABT1F5Q8_9PROT|nr:transglycosylase SLT domain-containing protein [Acetobacter lambici]MCP1243546.1 lytic transglycosylase domain-containing protein [Acetobacter lambici]MCP1259453.1 lytic transglycosylase domain-containing protein [Acetobacter lambici]